MHVEKQEEKPAVKRVTLAELGPSLPIGTVDPATNRLVKALSHKRWSLKTEKIIGRLRESNRRNTHARLATMIIGALYEQFGHHAFVFEEPEGKKNAAKSPWFQTLATLSSMWFGDMMYAYFYLRRECIGPSIDMDIACAVCGAKQVFVANLDTLEVKTVDELASVFWKYKLLDPMTIRGKEVVELVFGPSRWSAVEAAGSGGGFDVGAAKSSLIASSIAEVPGHGQIVVVDAELEDMSKRDLESILNGLEANGIGPDMTIESECGSCKNEFRAALDWTYDSFFKASGRSGQRRI